MEIIATFTLFAILSFFFYPKEKQHSIHNTSFSPIPVLHNTMYISAAEKKQYLLSKEWQILKQKRLALANNKCEHCSSTTSLNLHHTTYERLLHERLTDLRILCQPCHSKLHNKLGYDRETQYPITILKD